MKSLSIIFCVGAILGVRVLPAHGKPVGISQRGVKGYLPRGVTLCNDIHGCRGSYVESSKRRDLASLIWPRASGEGAAGEGAAGEGAAGEGAAGEGAQGEGAQGEGAQGEGSQGEGSQGEGSQGEPPSNPPSEIPPSEPSVFLVESSDGATPDRPSSDIGTDDDPNTTSPENQEVLPLSTYAANGQRYYDLMMQAVHIQPKREPIYDSINVRYRLRSEPRSPLAPDPQTPLDTMAAVLHLEPIASPPEIGIDLRAGDWRFQMLTAKGQPIPDEITDIEDDATIVTYASQSQKTIIVTKSDSTTNDIPDPANPDAPKVPNSELMFQLLQQQAGDAVSDTRLIIRHAITQKGTMAVLIDAHKSKGLEPTDMGTWTSADGEVFRRLLGNRNGRPGVFMLTDHPTAMKCKVVTKVFTWAQIPGDPKEHGAMAMEIGRLDSC